LYCCKQEAKTSNKGLPSKTKNNQRGEPELKFINDTNIPKVVLYA